MRHHCLRGYVDKIERIQCGVIVVAPEEKKLRLSPGMEEGGHTSGPVPKPRHFHAPCCSRAGLSSGSDAPAPGQKPTLPGGQADKSHTAESGVTSGFPFTLLTGPSPAHFLPEKWSLHFLVSSEQARGSKGRPTSFSWRFNTQWRISPVPKHMGTPTHPATLSDHLVNLLGILQRNTAQTKETFWTCLMGRRRGRW